MFNKLTKEQYKMIKKIEPSKDREIRYYPCDIILDTNEEISCVYIVDAETYIKYWGIYPSNDKGKKEIKIENVKSIRESKYRIPAKYVNELYSAGESGMGYTLFKVIFKNSEQSYHSGNAFDFIEYPDGNTKKDVKKVTPHDGRNDPYIKKTKDYYWCLFEK